MTYRMLAIVPTSIENENFITIEQFGPRQNCPACGDTAEREFRSLRSGTLYSGPGRPELCRKSKENCPEQRHLHQSCVTCKTEWVCGFLSDKGKSSIVKIDTKPTWWKKIIRWILRVE